MKTIYNLQKGDNYWRPSPVIDLDKMSGKFEPRKIEIINEIDLLKYKTDLTYCKVSLTKKDCQKSIDYDAAITKINKRASELEQEVELLEDYQYIDLHESKHRGLTIHPTHYIDCAKPEKYAREKIPYKLCFDYNVCVSLIEELPNEVKTVLGVD